jgi:hypothetical protein
MVFLEQVRRSVRGHGRLVGIVLFSLGLNGVWISPSLAANSNGAQGGGSNGQLSPRPAPPKPAQQTSSPGSSSPSIGASISGNDLSHPEWMDTSKYTECGQDCIYGKGNANLALQGLYIIKKAQKFIQIMAGNKTDDFKEIVGELKAYCPDEKEDEKGAKICLKRYLEDQLPVLRSIQRAVIGNDDTIFRLQDQNGALAARGGKPGSSKVSVIATLADPNAKPKKAQIPNFSRADDFSVSQESLMEMQKLGSVQYAEWAAQHTLHQPSRDDFIKIETQPDPLNPSSTISKIVHNADGSTAIDEAAYQAAMKQYNADLKAQQALRKQTTLADDSKKHINQTLAQIDGNMNITKGSGKNGNFYNIKPKYVDIYAYKDSRNIAIAETEKMLKAKGVLPEQSYPGAGRQTASISRVKSVTSTSKKANIDKTQNSLAIKGKDAVFAEGAKQVDFADPVIPSKVNEGATYSIGISPQAIQDGVSLFESYIVSLTQDINNL